MHRGFLGPYGNTWLETPAFNRLAAASFTFDQALVTAPTLPDFYAAVWQGQHPWSAPAAAGAPTTSPERNLLAALHERQVTTTLVTDDADVANLPLALFDEVIRVPARASAEAAATVHETALAALFGQAAECLEEARGPFLLWVHAASLTKSFDAPLTLRNSLVDDDETLPSQSTAAPQLELADGYDPDELLGWRRCYAGQVQALDELLGGLLSAVAEHPQANETLLSLISPRGYALGEHRRVGSFDAPLHSELVHVPWHMRLPEDALGKGRGRSQALVQPTDLCASLARWFGAATFSLPWDAHDLTALVCEDSLWPRDRLAIAGATGERALRTARWYLRQPGNSDGGAAPAPELFVKPDDLWDVNEIAARCPDVAAQLAAALVDYAQKASISPFALSAPLADLATSVA